MSIDDISHEITKFAHLAKYKYDGKCGNRTKANKKLTLIYVILNSFQMIKDVRRA
jgi:hypothetical protein